MNLLERGKRLIQDECYIVQKQVDELDEEVQVDTRLGSKMLSVDWVRPNTLNDLEDFVSYVKLVEELRMGSCALTFYVELHECVQQVLHSNPDISFRLHGVLFRLNAKVVGLRLGIIEHFSGF